jgi:ribonuclease HI
MVGNVHSGVQMWERGRQQEGELTTGAAVGNTSYEVDDNAFDHDTGVWRCAFCARAFSQHRDLVQHLESGVHEEKAYRCSTCDRKLSSLSGLHARAEQTGHQRPARQVRVMLGDAARVQEQLLLTDRSAQQVGSPPPEGFLFFDGGAQPNPGVGGAGFILKDDRKQDLTCISIRMSSQRTTNNQAEYIRMLVGLTYAVRQGMKRLSVYGDSDLVIKQMNGEFRVNSDSKRPYYDQAQALVKESFAPGGVTFSHIPREFNSAADALARRAIAGRADFVF